MIPSKKGHWRFQFFLIDSDGEMYSNAIETTAKPNKRFYAEFSRLITRNVLDTYRLKPIVSNKTYA